MRNRWICYLVAALGLCLMAGLVWTQREWLEDGGNDFAAFYSGAHLVGSGELYNARKLQANEDRFLGDHSPNHGYVRPPFHAVFLWPLTRLPYMTAFLVWEFAALAAFALFVALWRPPEFPLTLLFSCFALPAFSALVTGQDVTFLLAVIAAAMLLDGQGRKFAAGAVFSLCAAKFHLFLLTPVLIVGARAWGFGRGLLAGGAALAAVSFAAEGWNWPVEFVRSALDPAFTPSYHLMPNLTGQLEEMGAGAGWEWALSATIVAGAWTLARRAPFRQAFAYCLLGGVLLSRHSYLADAALWLPAGLTILASARTGAAKTLGGLLLIPVTYLAAVTESPLSLSVLAALLLCYVMVWEATASAREVAAHAANRPRHETEPRA